MDVSVVLFSSKNHLILQDIGVINSDTEGMQSLNEEQYFKQYYPDLWQKEKVGVSALTKQVLQWNRGEFLRISKITYNGVTNSSQAQSIVG